jgi:hypothetical protein
MRLRDPGGQRTDALKCLLTAYGEVVWAAAIAANERQAALSESPTHRHLARGTLYTELHRGLWQTSVPLGDMAELVTYRGADGKIWHRPPAAFDDEQRFALVRD